MAAHLECVESIVSSHIEWGASRVVAQGSVRPQNVAHVLWVVLPNALLQMVSSSLQHSNHLVSERCLDSCWLQCMGADQDSKRLVLQ